MLNGKFFTGLPPKMIERSSSGRNRMESHFFWPDDTQVETAVESRVKRRSSFLSPDSERPSNEKQSSTTENEVDTKKRFSREFSQSSIQFYDNLNDDRTNSHKPMLRTPTGARKTEIAEKPTNTKLKLPENVVDEAYTIAKKKQVYASKIQFYDYINEEEEPQNNRNNLRKPKMDMNDKREMELNTKNSPKLQVKRDVRSLSEEKETRKINNREVKVSERPKLIKPSNVNDTSDYNEKKQERILKNEESYLNSKGPVEPRLNLSPKRGLQKTRNNYNEQFPDEREPVSLNYERREPINYRHSEEIIDYRTDFVEPHKYAKQKILPRDVDKFKDKFVREEPKRTIRHNTRAYYEPRHDSDYSHDYREEEELGDRMSKVQLKSSPRKQYHLEEYYDENSGRNYRRDDQIRQQTNRGSSQHHFVSNDGENVAVDLSYDDVKTCNSSTSLKKVNNPIDNKVTTLPSPPASDVESQNATKIKKHLRSSLSFHDGAIIADNEANLPPTSQHTQQRRKARSSATRRVSVGLPD